MARGSNTEDLMILAVLAIGGYLVYTKTDLFQQGLDAVKGLIGGGLGGSGSISEGGGCPGGTNCGPCRNQSGGRRCECNNYKGDAYEATFCGTWSGDDLSIKMWGPNHTGKNCCWCILSVSPNGQMKMRGEGPHPSTGNLGGASGGSVGGKPSCVKALIRPGSKGAHVEGYGLVNGSWKKGLTYDGPCGNKEKKTKAHPNQQVSFRCDGKMDMKCATVKPLSNVNYVSAGQYSNSLFAYNDPMPLDRSRLINVR